MEEFRLSDILGRQIFHENIKQAFEPVTGTSKKTSENITKTIMLPLIENNKAIEKLNENGTDLTNDKGMISPCLASSSINFSKPENKKQIKFKEHHNSIRMIDFSLNGGVPVTLYSKMLTFRDSKKSFKLKEDLLENNTNYDFNVRHSYPKDQNLNYEFGKDMNFNIMQKRRKSDRDKSLVKLPKQKAIMASWISTIFLPSDPKELCDR